MAGSTMVNRALDSRSAPARSNSFKSRLTTSRAVPEFGRYVIVRHLNRRVAAEIHKTQQQGREPRVHPADTTATHRARRPVRFP
jgi:hypothetical protein